MTLRALERIRRGWSLVVLSDEVHNMFQTQQVYELRVGRIWDKVHLWWRGFGGRNLKQKATGINVSKKHVHNKPQGKSQSMEITKT